MILRSVKTSALTRDELCEQAIESAKALAQHLAKDHPHEVHACDAFEAVEMLKKLRRPCVVEAMERARLARAKA